MRMLESLLIGASVAVDDGCSMRGIVHGADGVEFVFAEHGKPCFDLSFDAEGLRRFVALAACALADMDHRHACDLAGTRFPAETTELDAADLDAAQRGAELPGCALPVPAAVTLARVGVGGVSVS